MAENSKIEWTDASWTPIRARNIETGKAGWHCEHVSEGCRNCYAEAMNARLGTGLDFKPAHLDREDISLFLDERMLTAPLRWSRPRKIFVCSMTDLFGRFVPDEWIDRMFAVMALCPQHIFQIVTKRPERMRAYLCGEPQDRWNAEAGTLVHWDDMPERAWPLSNVWLGFSAEDQDALNTRWRHVAETPAAVRFLSYEPALGPLDLRVPLNIVPHLRTPVSADSGAVCGITEVGWIQAYNVRTRESIAAELDWVIVGGESGPGARPMHPDWARSLRDQCAAASVPFFFKQWGAWNPMGDHGGPFVQPNRDKRRWLRPDGVSRPSIDAEAIDREESRDGRDHGWALMLNVGKKAAGRVLDGRTHDGMPAVGSQEKAA